MANEIYPTSAQSRVKNGALLVDEREKNEVEQLTYRVPNIVNIPLSEFEFRYQELPLDKNLVMVCRGGGSSLRAACFLINHGYDTAKVVNMRHGMIRRAQKGFLSNGDATTVLETNTNSGCCGSASAKTSIDKSACCNSPKGDGSACC